MGDNSCATIFFGVIGMRLNSHGALPSVST